MGAETTHRTRKAILEAVREKALGRLDGGDPRWRRSRSLRFPPTPQG